MLRDNETNLPILHTQLLHKFCVSSIYFLSPGVRSFLSSGAIERPQILLHTRPQTNLQIEPEQTVEEFKH